MKFDKFLHLYIQGSIFSLSQPQDNNVCNKINVIRINVKKWQQCQWYFDCSTNKGKQEFSCNLAFYNFFFKFDGKAFKMLF